MRSVLRLLASGLVIGLFCVIASAQAIQTGGIAGVVSDKAGALVAGATVDVISEATAKSVRSMTTGGDGGFAVTLGIGIVMSFTDSNLLEGEFTTYGTQCAAYLMYAAPVILFYVALQKWFIRGLTEGLKL